MIEKFNCFSVQGKVIGVFIIEKVDGMRVQFQTECFQEQYVVSHYIFVGEVKLVHNNWVDVVVAQ